MDDGLASKIRDRLNALGKTPRAASLEAGLSDAFIRNILTGKSGSPRSENLQKLARVLDVSMPWLMDETQAIPMPSIVRTGFKPPPKFVGEHELPVYASVEAGPGEMIISTDQPIDVVARPWFMGTVTDGYAVLVVGESMVPAFEPGDYAIINPRLPVMRNKDVILTGGEDEGEFRATIKRLVSWTTDDWMLRQFNPPEGESRDFRRPKRDWPKAVRVVGKWIGS